MSRRFYFLLPTQAVSVLKQAIAWQYVYIKVLRLDKFPIQLCKNLRCRFDFNFFYQLMNDKGQ